MSENTTNRLKSGPFNKKNDAQIISTQDRETFRTSPESDFFNIKMEKTRVLLLPKKY